MRQSDVHDSPVRRTSHWRELQTLPDILNDNLTAWPLESAIPLRPCRGSYQMQMHMYALQPEVCNLVILLINRMGGKRLLTFPLDEDEAMNAAALAVTN